MVLYVLPLCSWSGLSFLVPLNLNLKLSSFPNACSLVASPLTRLSAPRKRRSLVFDCNSAVDSSSKTDVVYAWSLDFSTVV